LDSTHWGTEVESRHEASGGEGKMVYTVNAKFWTPHFLTLDSTLFRLDSIFWFNEKVLTY